MTKSFDLDAPTALAALERCFVRHKQDETESDIAREFAVRAWHLCEHAHRSLSPKAGFAKLQEFQRRVRSECPELAWLRDICTETKHGTITRYAPMIESARLHRGEYDHRDYDPRDYNTDRLVVTLANGDEVVFGEVAERALCYWRDRLRRDRA